MVSTFGLSRAELQRSAAPLKQAAPTPPPLQPTLDYDDVATGLSNVASGAEAATMPVGIAADVEHTLLRLKEQVRALWSQEHKFAAVPVLLALPPAPSLPVAAREDPANFKQPTAADSARPASSIGGRHGETNKLLCKDAASKTFCRSHVIAGRCHKASTVSVNRCRASCSLCALTGPEHLNSEISSQPQLTRRHALQESDESALLTFLLVGVLLLGLIVVSGQMKPSMRRLCRQSKSAMHWTRTSEPPGSCERERTRRAEMRVKFV